MICKARRKNRAPLSQLLIVHRLPLDIIGCISIIYIFLYIWFRNSPTWTQGVFAEFQGCQNVHVMHSESFTFVSRGCLAYIPKAMSKDDLVSRGWSCATLQEGVTAAARMAGLSLEPGEMNDAIKAKLGSPGIASCKVYIYTYVIFASFVYKHLVLFTYSLYRKANLVWLHAVYGGSIYIYMISIGNSLSLSLYLYHSFWLTGSGTCDEQVEGKKGWSFFLMGVHGEIYGQLFW